MKAYDRLNHRIIDVNSIVFNEDGTCHVNGELQVDETDLILPKPKGLKPLDAFKAEINNVFGREIGDCENCNWPARDRRICDICEVIAEALEDMEG